MVTTETLNSNKKETSLQINSFDKPEELSGVSAWSQLMLNLIFLKPGTYPSLPQMGVGIEDYQYDFLDEAVESLSTAITEQQKVFLPDVPLSGLKISKIEKSGQPILVIQLYFDTADGAETSAIAINTSKRNFLDFDVSW